MWISADWHLLTARFEPSDNRMDLPKNWTSLVDCLEVWVQAIRSKMGLQLRYRICVDFEGLRSFGILNWQTWQADDVKFCDFLWQDTCLECFLGRRGFVPYLEINARPRGAYALYRFESYRSPKVLPPKALYLDLKSDQIASIAWTGDQVDNKPLKDWTRQEAWANQLAKKDKTAWRVLARQFDFAWDQLPDDLAFLYSFDEINPCVILFFGDLPIYFAKNHAPVADFHDRAFWLV